MLYEKALTERKSLESQILSLQSQLKQLPKGNIFCSKNGKYYKWYLTNGSGQTYLPKKKRRLAEKLAAKKYISLLLEELLHEKKAIDFYLRHHNSMVSRSEQMLLYSPEYKELLTPYFKPFSQELSAWSKEPFQANQKYPEQLVHKTLSGNLVRSKSEVMIDMFLYKHKIPFRYEAPLQLGDTLFYPDFTIRHPETGKFFYWEHFGLVDDYSYCQNMLSKLKYYTSHGIFPSIQLITTYETKDVPLSAEMVEKIVSYYFLDH